MPVRTLSAAVPDVEFERSGQQGANGIGNALATLIALGPQLARIEAERKQQAQENTFRQQQLGMESQRTGFEGQRLSDEASYRQAEIARQNAALAAQKAERDRDYKVLLAKEGVAPVGALQQTVVGQDQRPLLGITPTQTDDTALSAVAQRQLDKEAAARAQQLAITNAKVEGAKDVAGIRATAATEWRGQKLDNDEFDRMDSNAHKAASTLVGANLSLLSAPAAEQAKAYQDAYEANMDAQAARRAKFKLGAGAPAPDAGAPNGLLKYLSGMKPKAPGGPMPTPGAVDLMGVPPP
jgi:hypothetical protein